jgi:hypothetical protein
MTYDPAWDMPKVNWQQQGSFEQGELALVDHPSDAPLVCIPPINRHWLPYILGCLDQLTNPSTWIVADDTALNAILDKAIELKQLVGSAGSCVLCPQMRLNGCVLQFSCDLGATWTDVTGWVDNFGPCVQSAAIITTPPPNPDGRTTTEMACSVASYLTDQIITVSIQQAVDNINNNRNLLQLGIDLALVIPEFVLVGLFVNAVADLYTFFSSSTVADFEAALSDPTLFSDIRCAIYNAILADGHLTPSNFTTVLTNIGAISYVHSNVVAAIHDYLQTAGFAYVNQLSQGAGLNPFTVCSDCGGSPTWCYQFDFNKGSDHGTTFPAAGQGVYTPLVGIQSQVAGGLAQLLFKFPLPSTQSITQINCFFSTVGTVFPSAEIDLIHSGVTVAFGGSIVPAGGGFRNLSYTPGATVCDNLEIRLNCNGTNTTTVQFVQVFGTGVNPFGDNCP